MDTLLNPLNLLALIILIYSAILHEIAHGYIADRLGDPTARLVGRLTLNPIPHIDPMLTIAIPLLLILSGSPVIFGGAKPVPVDPFNLRDGRKDIALVSLAGPLTNVLIAALAGAIFYLFHLNAPTASLGAGIFSAILEITIKMNVLLAVFNLLPIPPLDGSKVFALLLPEREANAYLSLSAYGMFILLFLLLFPIGPFSLQSIIFTLYSFILSLFGF